VKSVIQLALGILLFGSGIFQTQAAFTSLYIFGDALSTTADTPTPMPAADYYGTRDSNGRVWVEVLAQRQGLTYDPSKNKSYFDHNSAISLADVKNFTITPANVTNALFIVWVCNSDTYDAAKSSDSPSAWNIAIKQSQTNYLQIITNLYAKGVRTLILPNAVDISKIPGFNINTLTNTIHAGCTNYNIAFSNTISQARGMCPDLKIYTPDFFTLLNNVLTNAAGYGLTNALYQGLSIDALSAHGLDPSHFAPPATNGFGTNFIFWDPNDPTAKFHEVIADVAQQLISPVQIGQFIVLTGSNRLDVVNYPAGLGGFVDSITNLVKTNWTAQVTITSTNTAQSFFVTPSGSLQFYRLRFPYAWSWP
jgi:phospholipase/lecithinase/hemolysin